MALDGDDLEDARADLIQAGGDRKSVLDRALEEHESAQRSSAQMRSLSGPVPASLWGELMWWLGLNARSHDIEAARAQAAGQAGKLTREHETLEALSTKQKVPEAGSADDEDPANMVARLKRLSDQRKAATELDKRGQDLKQLGNVYQRWLGVIAAREREVLHQIFRSVALLLATVLFALIATRVARGYLALRGDSMPMKTSLKLASRSRRSSSSSRTMSMLACV